MDKPRIVIDPECERFGEELEQLLKDHVIIESFDEYTKRLTEEVAVMACEYIQRPPSEFEKRQEWLDSIRKKKDRRKYR